MNRQARSPPHFTRRFSAGSLPRPSRMAGAALTRSYAPISAATDRFKRRLGCRLLSIDAYTLHDPCLIVQLVILSLHPEFGSKIAICLAVEEMTVISVEAVMCLSPEICFLFGGNIQNTSFQMPVARPANR